MENLSITPIESNYQEIVQQALVVIETARSNAARSVISNVNIMHWEIGRILHEHKIGSKYGDNVIKRLSIDLKSSFPNMGLSVSNLWNMKRFYVRFYNAPQKLQQAVVVLPWGHINYLMTKFKDDDNAIEYYANEYQKKAWSRELLINAVSMEMHKRSHQNNSCNNFALVMPTSQATFANEIFKDSYCLGFLGVTEPILELELERRLVEKIKNFLLELGQGFTYIGNQHILSFNNHDYRVDMLFFHRKLKSLVAIDLKISEFKPEYVGKMNFYLSLLDRFEKSEDENPSIGVILCAHKDNVDVELALDGISKPIGVAEYNLIIPQKELKQIISEEINFYKHEIENKLSI